MLSKITNAVERIVTLSVSHFLNLDFLWIITDQIREKGAQMSKDTEQIHEKGAQMSKGTEQMREKLIKSVKKAHN